MKRKMIPGLIVASLMLTACGGNNYSRYETGNMVVMEGVVDNVVRTDLPNKKEIYAVTSVGFENGESLNLVGMYPGISRGKKVKITAEFVENVNKTDLFRVKQIIAVTAAEAANTPAAALPAAALPAAALPAAALPAAASP